MLTDVGGIRVGHATNQKALTGCTVVICDEPMLGGVDIRGSNTATRDTPRLRPVSATQQVHAVVLTGGSGFGLEATTGVASYLEEHRLGMDVDGNCLPVVTGAVLYDLDVGDPRIRPDKEMGIEACRNAGSGPFARGNAGAGSGATVGKFYGIERATKGGIGTWTERSGDVTVSALVAVNAFGDVIDPSDGGVLAGVRTADRRGYLSTIELMKQGERSVYWSPAGEPRNTTLGVVATNAAVTAEEITKIAEMAAAGLARTINPVHALFDGDVLFAIGRMCSSVRRDATVLGAIAAVAVQNAILDAVRSATSTSEVLAYLDFPAGVG